MTKLASDIAAWDRRSKAGIERVFTIYGAEAGFRSRLIDLSGEPKLEAGATWLIKHGFDMQAFAPFGEKESRALLHRLCAFQDWPAKLHMLQCFEHFDVPRDLLPKLDLFLDACADENRVLIRGWRFWALTVLAEQYPDRMGRAQEMLEAALVVETAGSVRAIVKRSLARLNA